MKLLEFHENGLNVCFGVNDAGKVALFHLSERPFEMAEKYEKNFNNYMLVDIQQTGQTDNSHNGGKHWMHHVKGGLNYSTHTEERNEYGLLLTFTLVSEELEVKQFYQFYDGVKTVSAYATVTNKSDNNVGLEYISSLCLTGFGDGQKPHPDRFDLYIANNKNFGETDWRKASLREHGFSDIVAFCTKRIYRSNTGTWSTKEHLPMGCLYNNETDESYMWQIEANGSWHWELTEANKEIALHLSGPTEIENGWWKNLKPGETFETVRAALTVTKGDFGVAVREMTEYRRKTVPARFIDKSLPVIFNDYMVCLNADPTTEKEIPVIDKAAEMGAEIYCMDAGWYAEGSGWWSLVGEWEPSTSRFPSGLKKVFDYVREKGMKAGIWVEPEVMGINCPLVPEFEDCFFKRHGINIVDKDRYQLDFRKQKVIDRMNAVVDRLIEEFGIEYFKFDYNIDPGIGTELDADSFGDGLLEANRAYLKWVDGLYERHPGLMIENCASGAMRIDGESLKHFTIQSLSDASRYNEFAYLSAMSPTVVMPEQAGVWVCPRSSRFATFEQNGIAAVNAMLYRYYPSGHIGRQDEAALLDDENFQQQKKAVEVYKSIRHDIPGSKQYYPIGIMGFESPHIIQARVSGDGKVLYVTAANISGDEDITIPLGEIKGAKSDAKVLFPDYVTDIKLLGDDLKVKLPVGSGVLVKIDLK